MPGLDVLGKVFVNMCATLFPTFHFVKVETFCTSAAICCEKIHSLPAGEIMKWGNLTQEFCETLGSWGGRLIL